MAIVGDDQIAH